MNNDEKLHWLDVFKQFLIDNKAENFWLYTTESELLEWSYPTSWTTTTFLWAETNEGLDYWSNIHHMWNETVDR